MLREISDRSVALGNAGRNYRMHGFCKTTSQRVKMISFHLVAKRINIYPTLGQDLPENQIKCSRKQQLRHGIFIV